MLSLETILVPIDFSDCSKKAFEYALALQKEHGAEILALHVIDTSRSGIIASCATNVIDTVRQSVQEMTRELMAGFFDEEAADSAGIKRIVISGNPFETILRVAAERDVELIVMGTYGWTPLARLFGGSVAEKVVRKAQCPVLVVRSDGNPVAGSRFSGKSDRLTERLA